MSLLDDAREMAGTDVADNFDHECPFCGMTPSLHGVAEWTYAPDTQGVLHYPDCPWLAMPKIIAVIEASARLGKDAQHGVGTPESDDQTCWFCMQGDPQKRDIREAGHADHCPWQALVAALEEVVPRNEVKTPA